MRRAGIETTVSAAREAGDFAKGLLGDRVEALLEHERRYAKQSEFAGGMTEIIELLFHGVADEDQRLHLRGLGFALGMRDDLADLRVAAAAIDAFHQRREPLGLRDPARGAAFAETAIVNQLHVEPADCRRFTKHVCLEPTGRVPHGLAAHGGIECENEAPPLARLGRRSKLLHPGKESVDLRALGWRRRRAAAIGRWPVLTIIGHGSRNFTLAVQKSASFLQRIPNAGFWNKTTLDQYVASVLRSRSSQTRLRHNDATFAIGTLAASPPPVKVAISASPRNARRRRGAATGGGGPTWPLTDAFANLPPPRFNRTNSAPMAIRIVRTVSALRRAVNR